VTIHIFISSTSKDLLEYRQAAIDVCNRLQFVPIGMEFFNAMGAGATEGSKQRIKQADVYVGLFAYRYGYVEEGYEQSVTEIEFQFAGERNLDRLCFLVDPTYPWPVDAIDRQQLDAVEHLRERVERNTIRELFTTVDDFRVKLIASLADWLQAHPRDDTVQRVETSLVAFPNRATPPLPALLIGRDRDLKSLKERLGVGAETMRPLTVVRGWPGVGKTTLLAALAYDQEVEAAYPDGVLWASVGEEPEPVDEMAEWAGALGLSLGTVSTLDEAMARTRAILADKRALLIVDDVWESDAAQPFRVGGPRCATLYTTRFPAVARSIAVTLEDVYVLDRLSDDDGVALLGRLTPAVVEAYPEQCRQLVADLEGLPLALRVAGRLLERDNGAGFDVEALFRVLGNEAALIGESAPEDRFDPRKGTTPTIDLLLSKSVDRLDPITRERFIALGAFAPKPATFDLGALRAVWMINDPRPPALELVDRGLLEPIPSQGRFWMHAILVMHATALLERL
jgi:hypothetical protein